MIEDLGSAHTYHTFLGKVFSVCDVILICTKISHVFKCLDLYSWTNFYGNSFVGRSHLDFFIVIHMTSCVFPRNV